MKKTNYMKLVVNFVPILLLYFLVTYTPEFVKFSHTVLGKAFAVILILFYVKLDFILGLFVCALVILYYQTDYVESFNTMQYEGFTEGVENENKEKKSTKDESESENENENKEKDKKPTKSKDEGKAEQLESFETLNDAYPLEATKQIKYDKNVDNFRKTYCKKGHLIHKGQIIKPEMAQHVFPHLEQSEYKKCNICDTSCEFEINDNRIKADSDLTFPKSSNDMFETVWKNLKKTTEQWMNR